jgi:hypothetical protein
MTLLENVGTEYQRERYWMGLGCDPELGHSLYSRKMNELDAKGDG